MHSCLREVEKIEGLERIRFMTSHPKDLSDELIEVMRDSKKICSHLHLPLQSGSSEPILKADEPSIYKGAVILTLVDKIRAGNSGYGDDNGYYCGLSGRNRGRFAMKPWMWCRQGAAMTAPLLLFIRNVPGRLLPQWKIRCRRSSVKERFDRLLKVVQDTARERVARLEGQTLEALVEEVNEHDFSLVTGRFSNNTIVHFKGDPGLIGKIVPVYLKECHGFYYLGELIEKEIEVKFDRRNKGLLLLKKSVCALIHRLRNVRTYK